MGDAVTIPLFPLPNLVFFPNTLLPLHVFEPRFKAMLEDVIASGGDLGVVQLKPGWETDYYGNPPVYRVFGTGSIVRQVRHQDGRFDIVLSGRRRARILSEELHNGYRLAKAELLDDDLPEERRAQAERDYAAMRPILDRIVAGLPEAMKDVRPQAWTDPEPGVLADILANTFMEHVYDKQCVLNETDISRRLRLVFVRMQAVFGPDELQRG